MAQVKIYGSRQVWGARRPEVSDAVHAALVSAWQLPPEKRFHRFVLAEEGDVVVPQRGEAYLALEIVCFSGRTQRAKRALIAAMYDDVAPALGLSVEDLEIVILESRRENWGIRGLSGDELALSYTVTV